MSPSLPDKPSLEHLKKQAKDILKAQRTGDASGCRALRHLHRFAAASESAVLAARVTLKEAQFALAMEYGLSGWEALRRHVRSQQLSGAATLEAAALRCEEEIPEYAGAGVPLAVVAALNHAGVDIDFMAFAAASGWAFSFGYRYDDISPAFMAVRGSPAADGPYEVFAFLPQRLGFDYEMARITQHDALWDFVRRHVDAGTPIMSEHLDGGLISGYRQDGQKRQVYFDGTVVPGWTNIEDLHPFAVYVLARKGEPMAREEITGQALKRAVAKGSRHEWEGAPQGLAALEAYLADVANPAKDFARCGEWFCWAAFERLMARKCCAVWLRSAAEGLDGQARRLVLASAGHYGEAFESYDNYRSEVGAGEPTALDLQQRARTPERLSVLTPLLEKGIAREKAGLEALRKATRSLD